MYFFNNSVSQGLGDRVQRRCAGLMSKAIFIPTILRQFLQTLLVSFEKLDTLHPSTSQKNDLGYRQ